MVGRVKVVLIALSDRGMERLTKRGSVQNAAKLLLICRKQKIYLFVQSAAVN